MSELAIKAMGFAERMEGTEFHDSALRDLLIKCSDELDANETHEAMLNQMLDDKEAIISELVGALEEIMSLTDDPENDADPEESAFTYARNVIAKARGHMK